MQLIRNQPPPFSMPSKLLTLHGEAKSYCSTLSSVPESMFHYLKLSDLLRFDMRRIKYIKAKLIACKQNKGVVY